jgi:probable phosphoglycerate mutase
MSDVVLIRPGCTDFDDQNRIQGALELPLNHRGQEQVEEILRRLHGIELDVVFCPPCEPARSTAIAVSEECHATLKEVGDFRNLDHGLWQGLQVEDARRKYPKVFKQWQESPETVCLPEGETVAEAVARLELALRKCLKRKKSVAIVASEPLATLIRGVLCGCRTELPESGASCCPDRMIEFLHLPEENGHTVGSAVAAGSANGPGLPAVAESGRASAIGSSNSKNGSANGSNGRTNKPAADPRGALQ